MLYVFAGNEVKVNKLTLRNCDGRKYSQFRVGLKPHDLRDRLLSLWRNENLKRASFDWWLKNSVIGHTGNSQGLLAQAMLLPCFANLRFPVGGNPLQMHNAELFDKKILVRFGCGLQRLYKRINICQTHPQRPLHGYHEIDYVSSLH